MVKEVPNIIFRLLDLGLERIIAEVIDNSLDKNADDVRVNMEIPDGDATKTMTVIRDNGDGFESVEHLFSCMEIEADEDVERGVADIGKYHIGLKIAPLTKYSRVDIVTKINGQTYSLAFFEPLSSGLEYNMNDPEHKNPTYPKLLQNRSEIPAEITDFIDRSEEGWTTLVFLSNPYRKLLEESFLENKNLRDSEAFQENLRRFLGITYERYFVDNPDLKMSVDGKSVSASDPFWKTFTPRNILAKIGEDTSSRATKLRRMSRFGTLEGYRFVSNVVPSLTVQPFVIPDELARKKFKEILAEGFRGDTPPSQGKAQNGGSFLDSNALAGFYFYRDHRLVAYGSFYELGITDFAANNIRIEISYKSQQGDNHFTVSPNKTRVDGISPEAYSEIYRGLKVECGGDAYATPFSISTPFFDSQNTQRPREVRGGRAFIPSPHAHYANTLVRGSAKWIQYKECSDEGCGLIHAPGDICPEAPCAICHRRNTCTPGECAYECQHCGLTGDHLSNACPRLCVNCRVIHEDGICPRVSERPSGGDCSVCGQSNCAGDCDSVTTYRSVISRTDDRVNLRLMRAERERIISLLKEALEELNITLDELS